MTFKFNIDFGQVIVFFTILVAMVAAYWDMRQQIWVQGSRVLGLEASDKLQLELNQRQLATNQQVVSELSQIRTDIAVIRTRIEAANIQAAENAVKITEAIDSKVKK